MPALFLSIAACLLAPGVQARTLSLTALGQSSRYDSVERFASGSIADEERGRPDGQELRLGLMDDQGRRWSLRWQRWHDRTAYQGRTQIGLPISTATDLAWTDAAAGAEWTVHRRENGSLFVAASLGQRTIDRAIQPTFFSTPLTERLDYTYALAAVGVDWMPRPSWTLSARWGMEQSLNARLHVDFHGVADPVTVSPGNRVSPVYELSVETAMSDNCRVTLGWRHHDLHIGASADMPYTVQGQATGALVRYPGSTQRLDTLMLGVTLSWH